MDIIEFSKCFEVYICCLYNYNYPCLVQPCINGEDIVDLCIVVCACDDICVVICMFSVIVVTLHTRFDYICYRIYKTQTRNSAYCLIFHHSVLSG